MRNGRIIQVSALPRSGTAWLSVLFNLTPQCIAFHELAATDQNHRQTIERCRLESQFVADVNTYGYMPGYVHDNAVKVFIRQPWEKSRTRAEKAAGWTISGERYAEMNRLAEEWAKDALVIEADYLFNLPTLRKVWVHCFGPLVPFPQTKVGLLIGMNIQRHNPTELFKKSE